MPLLLSNGGIVHIARKCDLAALLAAAVSGHEEVFCKFLKHHTCVVIAIKKFSKLLKATAAKTTTVVREMLKTGAGVNVPNKHG